MAEHVVDFLEVVEVEAEDREGLLCCRARSQHFRQMFRKGDTVGQIGQRVVMRHVRDLLLGSLAAR